MHKLIWLNRYHLIAPSSPGFAYSSKPGPKDDFNAGKIAFLFNGLMTGLGFESYAAQGGDIGSAISFDLGTNHSACKGELPSPSWYEAYFLVSFGRRRTDEGWF